MAALGARGVWRFTTRLLLAALLVVSVVAVFGLRLPSAWADGLVGPSPLLPTGREAEIATLLQPIAVHKGPVDGAADNDLGPAAAGWRVSAIDASAEAIRIRLRGPNDEAAALRLVHPARAPVGAFFQGSFSFVPEPPSGPDPDPAAVAALDAVARAIQRNDGGTFWGPTVRPRPDATTAPRVRQQWSGRFASMLENAPDLFEATFIEDRSIVLVLAVVFLALHLRRVLSKLPRWVTFAVLGIFVFSLGIRLALSLPTIMNAFPYRRVVPLAQLIGRHPVTAAILGDTGARLYWTDLIFTTDLLLASLTPVILFAHARYVLGSYRPALFAAGMLALLPMHIRFSYADSEVIQSICSSSLTFVVLYTALRERSLFWRAICFVLLPAMALATYWVRPENMSLYLLDVWAIFLTAGADVPRSRRLLALAEVTAASGYALVVHLLPGFHGMVESAFGMTTLKHLVQLAMTPSMITFLNPYFMPPGFIVLVVIGGVTLFRQGERLRAVFLAGWALGMFVVMSTVLNGVPAMEERYHLNLVTPLCMLAAASLPVLLKAPRRWQWAIGIYLAASPLIHLASIRDADFNEMHEFDLLRSHRDEIPEGCTVLEFQPAMTHMRTHDLDASRVGRVAWEVDTLGDFSRWYIINSGAFPAPTTDISRAEDLTPEARSLIEHPPACLYVYEGISCFSHRPKGTPRAPVCEALRRQLSLTTVASSRFTSRLYDEVNAGRLVDLPGGGMTNGRRMVDYGDPMELSLFRAEALKPESTTGATPPNLGATMGTTPPTP